MDADWASCIIDRRSYSGYCFTLNKACITREARKLRTPALSSVEAEYMGLTESAKEAAYLINFMYEILHKIHLPIAIGNDNQGARILAMNASSSARMKHVDLRIHFIHRDVLTGLIVIEYVSTEDMSAGILTKGHDEGVSLQMLGFAEY